MITRGVATWSLVRRCLSPTEWFVRWLRLPKSEPTDHSRGLVLIQVDGLSKSNLCRAIDNDRMPFLKSLRRREHYEILDLYSGLPASTPSVQGELFYGHKCAVPAFGFRDHQTGQVVRMFARDTAAAVEERISQNSNGILEGGSAYCNVYDGGAKEAHFCASSMGWSDLIQDISVWRLLPLLTWHFFSILRVVGLLLLEVILACLGFVKGAVTKREYWQELLMIPARVVVVILMRELAIIGATMDVARGLPIVQLNLLGYDEQAHRRSPESRFAHWTLKGIDAAMARLWTAAHRSARREYDVWIYSDHGQIATTPYEYVAGEPIATAAARIVSEICPPTIAAQTHESDTQADEQPDTSRQRQARRIESRASWLSTGWLVGKLFGEGAQDLHGQMKGVQVAALGPIGLIYSNRTLSGEQKLEIATRLVNEKEVPTAFVVNGSDVIGISRLGQFDLRQAAAKIFGEAHPFLQEVAADMIRLCQHPDAGDIVVSGWNQLGNSLSFAIQNGAHAGASPEETHAFVMAPRDVRFATEKGYLRPLDLRVAVGRFLHPEPPSLVADSWGAPYQQLRVMTYNVHGCVGMDNRLDPRRIARVIAQSEADIVALQELDVSRARSGFRDQAHEIARLLEMQCHFHPAWQLEEESYGDAFLSRVPMRLVRKGGLPAKSQRHEPRGAMWVEISPQPGCQIQLINTHLSLYPRERNLQAVALKTDWIRPACEIGTTIVCGDFNAQPRSPTYRQLCELTRDVQVYGARTKPSPTFFSPRPLARVDHIFVTNEIGVDDARVLDSRLARIASDHLPLIADVVLPSHIHPDSDDLVGPANREAKFS